MSPIVSLDDRTRAGAFFSRFVRFFRDKFGSYIAGIIGDTYGFCRRRGTYLSVARWPMWVRVGGRSLTGGRRHLYITSRIPTNTHHYFLHLAIRWRIPSGLWIFISPDRNSRREIWPGDPRLRGWGAGPRIDHLIRARDKTLSSPVQTWLGFVIKNRS